MNVPVSYAECIIYPTKLIFKENTIKEVNCLTEKKNYFLVSQYPSKIEKEIFFFCFKFNSRKRFLNFFNFWKTSLVHLSRFFFFSVLEIWSRWHSTHSFKSFLSFKSRNNSKKNCFDLFFRKKTTSHRPN